MLEKLSDELLISTYHQALKLNLDPLFIKYLEAELIKRGIHPSSKFLHCKDRFDKDFIEE
ncbi:sporulation histidine kinase inhibitor Sda [Bacillaceae bacterium S4-13-58]